MVLFCFESDCELLSWVLGAFSDWFLINRKDFRPQGVKQVVIIRFAFVWIKGMLTFVIFKENAWLNPHWLPIFSCFRPLEDSSKWRLSTEIGKWESSVFKGKNGLGKKLLAIVSYRIKALLRWKFQVQDLLHEFLNFLCPLGSMHGLSSCKRFERNRLIFSKPQFLNFPQFIAWAWAILKRIK